MNLTGEQIGKLQEALLSAYPSRQKLKEMVRIGLDKNLDAIASGEGLTAIVFNLVAWAEANSKVKELVFVAFQHNQGNEELRKVFADLFGFSLNQPRSQPSIKMPMLYDFDLDVQINECLNALWGKQGLVSFTIARSSYAFLQNLCERLKYELGGQDYVRLMKPLRVHPLRIPISQSILTVEKRCIPALKKRDVLLTVQFSEDKSCHDFWQSLDHVVERHNLQNRLIVVLVTEPDPALPEEVIPLTSPHFQIAHVHRWVRKVVSHFDWPEAIFKIITTHIISQCSHENELLVYWVYDYLEAIQELLKRNPTAEELKIELSQL